MRKNYKNYLFLSLLLTGSLFPSENFLEFEIVPFDYNDANMKEQLCAMVRDDQDIQRMTHDTEDKMKQRLADDLKLHRRSICVCRATDGSSIIYGYMNYAFIDSLYFWDDPVKGRRCCCSNLDLMDEIISYSDVIIKLETIKFVGHLDSLAVHKNYRGKGIAQAMLRHFEDDCKNNGMQLLMLIVDAINDQAIRSYLKSEYEINAAYNIYNDDYTMTKLIN